MTQVTLTTDEFWQKMGDARFIRLSPYEGRIEKTVYHTFDPPERVEGFMSAKILGTFEALLGNNWKKKLRRLIIKKDRRRSP